MTITERDHGFVRMLGPRDRGDGRSSERGGAEQIVRLQRELESLRERIQEAQRRASEPTERQRTAWRRVIEDSRARLADVEQAHAERLQTIEDWVRSCETQIRQGLEPSPYPITEIPDVD